MESSAPLLAAGLHPVFIRLRVFFQERSDGVPVEVLRVHPEQDLALMRTVGWVPAAQPLNVSDPPPEVREGQPVFLVGYPAGLNAVVARLEYREQAELEKATGSNDYAKALLLARRRQLRPSVTGGFLWEVLPDTLVYDAHTTGGGERRSAVGPKGKAVRRQRRPPFGISRDQLRHPNKNWAAASRGPWAGSRRSHAGDAGTCRANGNGPPKKLLE